MPIPTRFGPLLWATVAATMAFLASCGTAPIKPPVARIDPVTDVYFGTPVTDEYRYMEKLDDPEVKAWFKGQNAFCRAVLDRIPGRTALLDRITALDASRTIHVGLPEVSGGSYFYKKRRLNDAISKVYMRPGLTGAERLLIDPDAKEHRAGEHNAINYFVPSQDGNKVAYGISVGGSEDSVLHVVNSADGKDTSDIIDRARFGGVSWLPGGDSFFYNRLQKLPAGAPVTDKYQNSRVFWHKLGDDPDKDRPIFGAGLSPLASVASQDMPYCALVPGSNYVFGLVSHGVMNEITLYIAPLAAVTGARDAAAIPWVKVCDVPDAVTSFDIHGDDLFLLTHRNASRFKLVKTSALKPDFASASVVLPAGDAVITNVSAAKEALFVTLRDGGIQKLRRISYADNSSKDVSLPVEGSLDFSYDPRAEGGLVALTGWTRAYLIYALDSAHNTLVPTNLQPQGPYDAPDDLISEEVKVKAADGTLIPLTIVYKKGLKRDGSTPAWIEGYGAYGVSIDPGFGAIELAWLEKGCIKAYAHVRGGGEYGEDWHLAGKMLTKPNTWNDFIACAQYLVDNKYTSPAKLAGSGTSAGGILIGRALTTRPDLFGTACIDVGVSNALRSEFGANGVPNIPEFGTVKESEGFKALAEMDALSHVRDGVKYPAVLLTTGMNDPRVDPWEVAKMTARLQAATRSGNPVLLRVDYDAGHGLGSTKQQFFDLLADEESFFLWQAAVPDFQPKP
jgi:prolyl oligopeptidase